MPQPLRACLEKKKLKWNEIKKNSVWKNERMDSSVKQHSNDLVKIAWPECLCWTREPEQLATWTVAHRWSTITFLTFPKMTIHEICEGTTGWRIWTSLTPGCRQVRAGLDAGRLCVCQPPSSTIFSSPPLLHWAVLSGWRRILWRRCQAARLRQSPAEPRKKETRNKKGEQRDQGGGGGARTDRVTQDETRAAAHTADGHTDAQTWRAPRRKTTKRNYYGTSSGR